MSAQIVDQERTAYTQLGALGLCTLYMVLLLPESLRPSDRVSMVFSCARSSPASVLAHLRGSSLTSRLSMVVVLTSFCTQGVVAILLLFLRDERDFSSRDLVLFLVLAAASTIVSQTALLAALVGSFGERRTLLVGIACNATAAVGLCIAWTHWHFYTIAALLLGPGTLIHSTATSIISSEGDACKQQGALMTSLAAVRNLGK